MKKIKKNESGRSMVEMLGVLAIIGVLSVGGIAGYRYAAKQMTLNEVSNILNYGFMSILEEDSIYEAYRDEDGTMSMGSYAASSELTPYFAELYGLKCSEVGSDAYSYGCLLPNGLYWAIVVYTHPTSGVELFGLKLGAPLSKVEVLKDVGKQLAFQIFERPELKEAVYYFSGSGVLQRYSLSRENIESWFSENKYASGNLGATYMFNFYY